jgi:GDP-L-fucose synthase
VHEAKLRRDPDVTVWGSGEPRREFLHVDDLADATVYMMKKYDSEELVNIGCGEDVSIRELAELVTSVVGFEGSLKFDATKPDGTPRKLLDVSRQKSLGWQPRIKLRAGIESTYAWFKEHARDARL